MTAVLSPTLRAARHALVTATLDGGSLTLYSGVRPAFGSTSGIALQATLTMASPAGTLAGLVFTLTLPLAGLRIAAAAITWGRFCDATGVIVMDVDVSSTSVGTGDVLLDNTSGSIGAFVEITAATLTG